MFLDPKVFCGKDTHGFRFQGGMKPYSGISLYGIQGKIDAFADAGRFVQIEMPVGCIVGTDRQYTDTGAAVDPGVGGGAQYVYISGNQLQCGSGGVAHIVSRLGPFRYNNAVILECNLVQILDHGVSPSRKKITEPHR